ncbi:MAG: hypothetical protein M3270_06185 [Thermoproteota archaeon]|nr:hypothetical protein [Thermoproteota archaeon]
MHPDDLNAIWICHECEKIFLFFNDTIHLKDSTGHKVIEKRAMISLAGGSTG